MSCFSYKFISLVVFTILGVSSADAVECQDPTWTRAITEAMGRAPKAGECSARLYGAVETHQDKVRVVKEALARVYQRRGGSDMPTQQLPLTAQGGR